jgi:hypothetical protein
VEIRHYGPRLAAEVTVGGDQIRARSEGFGLLARYIFGGNARHAGIAMTAPVAQSAVASSTGQQIAMTTPVAQTAVPAGWRIQFFLPASYTMVTVPQPLDPRVTVVELPSRTFAVLTYTGDRAPVAAARSQARMLQGLEAMPWVPVGSPVSWFYDPPWTVPFLRRNEAAVEVAPR